MRILASLTYYHPHISGLTIYARRLLSGLARRGGNVTVLTSRYDNALAGEEMVDGARVLRTSGLFKLSKGILMPFYPLRAALELLRYDVLVLNLPQLEGAFAAVIARLLRKPVVTIVHCDIELPAGAARLFMPLIRASHQVTGLASNVLVVNSQDYVEGSRYLRRFRHKVFVSPPPCETAGTGGVSNLPEIGAGPVIGFVGRFAEEKGIAYLLEAAQAVLEGLPNAHFVFVGESERVLGERVHGGVSGPLRRLGDRALLTGIVTDSELAGWLRRFDVLVLPSVNSTESFGMVQVEAMLNGTPVVASDIAGVREPITSTGMGELVPPRSPASLAAAIIRVVEAGKDAYARPRGEIEALYGTERAVVAFESLLESLLPERAAARGPDPAAVR